MSSFNVKRTLAIAKKEFFHVWRDPFTMSLAFLLPILTVFIFGYAMEFNSKEIQTTYLDLDKTQSSRKFIEIMGSSNYFKHSPALTADLGIKEIEADRAKAFVYIGPDFEKGLFSGAPQDVQVIIDGSEGSFVGSITGYLAEIRFRAVKSILDKEIKPNVDMRTRYLFNPELNSRWFSIPGIVVVIMGILCSLLTTLTVAKEWENGSMELLLSTPVKPIEIIIGKLIPYAAICLGSVVMVYVLARLWFGVPFVGSQLIFWGGCFVFLAGYLAFGLVISVLIREQLPAMQAGIIAGMLPTTLLSGFIYPIANMPEIFKNVTMLLPARWFMLISREQFLKGSDIYSLFVPLVFLLSLTVFFIFLAVKMFKKDLEA